MKPHTVLMTAIRLIKKRLILTVDLLRKAGALPPESVISPGKAAEAQLYHVHSREYVQAVTALSYPEPEQKWLQQAEKYGLATEDTPFFPGMNDITMGLVGGRFELWTLS